MTNKETPATILNPGRFTATIKRQSEFIAAMPTHVKFAELSLEERRTHIKRGIARSALSIADTLEREKGEYDLDANLYKLVRELPRFYESQKALDARLVLLVQCRIVK